MTGGELYREVRARLEAAGCDSPAFDAACLLEDVGGLPRGQASAASRQPVPPERREAVERAARRRAEGYPLQYLLGEWDFLTLRLRVGEGVLIPRPDTECLCETAAAWLGRCWPREPAPRVLDLCAGTGCVGLGTASLYPGAVPTCVELSEAAWPYLTANLARYAAFGGTARRADVLTDPPFAAQYHALLANPPYIPTGELAGLMREVQYEPVMALDGAADGLQFYRAITGRWLHSLLPGGFCAVEVGCGQAAAVDALFAAAGLVRREIIQDLAGIPRVVVGQKPREQEEGT